MTTDPIVGLKGPDYEVPIERGAIRQFARSLYSSLPAWIDDRVPVIPPTFLVMAGYHWGYILERPPEGSELASITAAHGTTDGEQSFEFFGPPPRAGDVLIASTKVADHFFKSSKGGGRLEFFVMQTDFRDTSGRLLARWKPTSIKPERREAAAGATAPMVERPWLRRGDKRQQLDVIGAAATPLALGDSPGPVTMPALTLTDSIRYQCASGEDSPGHHDTLAARAAGLPDFISVGMHHAGVLGAYAAHWLGPENIRAIRARFLTTIWPGDVLTYVGRVSGFGERDEGPVVSLALECLRDAVPVVRAEATFLRPDGR
jgi:acyl dehydratase